MAEKSETLVTKEEKVNEAKELFGRGSRNYCMKQYADAADDLSACCSIYSELYGPNAEELGLPYLMYAKSLIALGKDENNLIVAGDEGEEVEEDDDEEDGEEGEEGGDEEEGAGEGEEKVEEKAGEEGKEKAEKEEPSAEKKEDTDEAMDTKEEKTAAEENGTTETEKDKEKDSTEDKAKVEAEAGGSSGTSSADANGEPQPGPSTSNGDTSAVQEDNADNLQVAWEILELAVQIFQQQGEKGYDNLSECFTELAGISFENSFFKEAIKDYVTALGIYKKTKQPDLRLLAEVNYKVGLCYMMEREFQESINSFKGAVAELEKVVEEEKAKEQTDEVKETIEDLEQMKQEILEKIADVEEAKKTPLEEVKRELSKIIVSGGVDANGSDLNNGAGTSSSAGGASSSSNGSTSKLAAKPATDISHLIKRKKPDSASMEVEGSPAKKTATETENAATLNSST